MALAMGKELVMSPVAFKDLAASNIVTMTVRTLNGRFNLMVLSSAIEGLVSPDGLILGKMGHSECYHQGLYKTNTILGQQSIFANGVLLL